MKPITCLTIFTFRDGSKEVTNGLEGQIHLEKGDIISLPNPLTINKSDHVKPAHSTHIKDSKIGNGEYEVQEVNIIYTTESFHGEERLEIKYSLSRLDK